MTTPYGSRCGSSLIPRGVCISTIYVISSGLHASFLPLRADESTLPVRLTHRNTVCHLTLPRAQILRCEG
jgi:hypothetical protein